MIANDWDADSLDRFIRQKSDCLLNIDCINSRIKRFEDGYGNDLSVFDVDCLKGIERLEIEDVCFKEVNRFVIDGLNELKNLPSLISIQLDSLVFKYCHSIVFESMND